MTNEIERHKESRHERSKIERKFKTQFCSVPTPLLSL
jgi:hypothetical protein